MRDALHVRPAVESDLDDITAIYAHAVRHETGTFELTPPDRAEMAARFARIAALGCPWLVAEAAAGVQGYAYAGPFRERAAYRMTVEDSVYVAEAARGTGVGRALLEALVERAARAGFRQMVALIGDSANLGSIRLHSACGFRRVGVMTACGFKHGRWVDTVLMQRALGAGAAMVPEPPTV